MRWTGSRRPTISDRQKYDSPVPAPDPAGPPEADRVVSRILSSLGSDILAIVCPSLARPDIWSRYVNISKPESHSWEYALVYRPCLRARMRT